MGSIVKDTMMQQIERKAKREIGQNVRPRGFLNPSILEQ